MSVMASDAMVANSHVVCGFENSLQKLCLVFYFDVTTSQRFARNVLELSIFRR